MFSLPHINHHLNLNGKLENEIRQAVYVSKKLSTFSQLPRSIETELNLTQLAKPLIFNGKIEISWKITSL